MSTWTEPLARRLGRRGTDRELGSTLLGIAVGAGLMFLFDPRAGRRRRALVRDEAASLVDDVGALANDRKSGPPRSAGHVLKPAALLGLGAASATYAGLALVRRRPLALVAGIVGTLAAAKAIRPEGRGYDKTTSERLRSRGGSLPTGSSNATTEPLPTGAGASERAPLAFGGEAPPSSGVAPTTST